MLSNKNNLPDFVVKAILADSYDKGAADLSVTELIDSPRVRALQIKHKDKIQRDATDMVWSLFGRACHHLLEVGAAEGVTAEERLFLDVDGYTISGGMDIQLDKGNSVKISDWKVTTSFAVRKGKVEWENQLNVYAHLVRSLKDKEVSELSIIALVRDWMRAKTDDPNYPQAPIIEIQIPVWEADKAARYVEERVALHMEARQRLFLNKPLPACTDEEMWADPPTYAVLKRGGKRALKVYDKRAEAAAHLNTDPDNLVIEERGAEPRRCAGDYCNVSQWCAQWTAWKESNRSISSTGLE